MLLLTVVTLVVGRVASGLVVSSCDDNAVSLQCHGPGEMIVVTGASFTPGQCPDTNTLVSLETLTNNRDILAAVVKQCNGVRQGQCQFDLHKALAESVSWGSGKLDVEYRCESNVLSYCGGRVTVTGQGYISSPGYPSYYLGGRECVWTIVAEPGQRIRVEVVDLALRDTGDKCEDSVEVREEGMVLLSLCAGTLQGRADILSSSPTLELRMRTAPSGQSLYPQRGLLLHYSVQGCPTPGPIADGSVEVSGDGDQATLVCDHDHVLQSSLTQSQLLSCDNTSWSWVPAIAHCVSIPFLLQYANKSVVSFLTGGQTALKLQDSNDTR